MGKVIQRLFDVDMSDCVLPCVTYALRRLGIMSLDVVNLTVGAGPLFKPDKFTSLPFNSEKLEVGDILTWLHPQEQVGPASCIRAQVNLSGSAVVSRRYRSGIHCGVYEGGGLYSHAIIQDECPVILLELIHEQRPPAWVYRVHG